MQTWSSDDNSVRLPVCPSVSLSVKRVDCDKTEERSVQIFIPYERAFSLVFGEVEWLVGATTSTLCRKKNIPDVLSYNSRNHFPILIIFGRNINEKVGNRKMSYF